MSAEEISHSKPGKAQFDHIYNQDDPRPYYNTLRELDYQIPAHGQAIFRRLIERQRESGRQPQILDLCCSYGITAALLNHDVTLDELYDHYGSPELDALSSSELVDADRAYYRAHRAEESTPVVGVDVADQAVAYGKRAGLLETASSANLETEDPDPVLAERLDDVTMVTVTGGVGYIGTPTFERVIDGVENGQPPWIAAFALRWVDYRPIAATLAERGLQTEKVDGHFPQRRFADDDERDYALGQLARAGVDASAERRENRYFASFYLSRPAAEARPPAGEILAEVL